MKKIIISLILLLTITTPVGASNEPQLHFADYFETNQYWTHFGHTSLVTDQQTGFNQLSLRQELSNGYTFIQLEGYHNGSTLPLQNDFNYNFDFALHDFAAGDSFDVIFYTFSDGATYLIRFQIDESGRKLNPIIYARNSAGELLNEAGDHDFDLANYFANDNWYTASINKSGSNLNVTVWSVDQPHLRMRQTYTSNLNHTYSDNTALPRFILDSSLVTSDRASVSLSRFFYQDVGYVYQQPVHLVAQTDPWWADDLLGSTGETDEPQTIGEIGCALSSATMIFNFHGYNSFPNGVALNPQTLNQWLSAQKDGYIKHNLLNWQALTRLSRILQRDYLAQGLSTPSFEYSVLEPVFNGTIPVANAAYTYLINRFPLIAELPGHFVAVAGGEPAASQLTIKDPYFLARTTIATETVQTLRLLKPSWTDQSYFIINLMGKFDNDLQLTASNGQTVDWTTVRLWPSGVNVTSAVGWQYLVPKPVSGSYQLSFGRDTNLDQVSIFWYNQDADVIVKSEFNSDEKSRRVIYFDYDKNGARETFVQLLGEPVYPWQYIRIQLDDLRARQALMIADAYLADYQRRQLVTGILFFQLQERLYRL